jgi:hypothetical protein
MVGRLLNLEMLLASKNQIEIVEKGTMYNLLKLKMLDLS